MPKPTALPERACTRGCVPLAVLLALCGQVVAGGVGPHGDGAGEPTEPPLDAAAPIGLPDLAPLDAPASARRYHGLGGTLALDRRTPEDDADPLWAVSADLDYRPIRDSALFAGLGLSKREEEDEPLFDWGLGYEDWRRGSWFLTLHHYGPLRAGDGLDIDGAVVDFGHKLDIALLNRWRLETDIALVQRISGDPAFALDETWRPLENWFLRAGLTQPLDGAAATYSYGLGYSNWRPYTFSLEYNRYAIDSPRFSSLHENGTLTASWKWEF